MIRTASRHPADSSPRERKATHSSERAVAGLPGTRFVATVAGMKLDVRHAGGELTVGSQKELLQLMRAGIVAPDDLVRREGHEKWVAAGELPWLRASAIESRKDSRRLVWITVVLMLLGLCGALFVQSHAARRAPRSTFPGGAVRAVPQEVR